MTLTQWWAPTVIRVSGDASIRGQLFKTKDGNVKCEFPKRIVMMANHQIYTDWLYLWWIAYTNRMHGRIYIILKESLKNIPVIGWGMQMSQFIFLKRNWEQDKDNLSKHMQKLNNPNDPMWLILFPEGTNLADCTRAASKAWADKNGIKDMENVLLPRATGLRFCLQELRKTVDYVYDCTIAYEGVKPGEYAQDIFTIQASYAQGKPPKSVNMYMRRFSLSSIPIDDAKAFELWLRVRWLEKDSLIRRYNNTGSFPADTGVSIMPDGTHLRGCGYVESSIKPFHWYEFLQVFLPMGMLSMVLFTFYGALPRALMKHIGNQKALDQAKVFTGDFAKDPMAKFVQPSLPPLPKSSATHHITVPRNTSSIGQASYKKVPKINPDAPKLGAPKPKPQVNPLTKAKPLPPASTNGSIHTTKPQPQAPKLAPKQAPKLQPKPQAPKLAPSTKPSPLNQSNNSVNIHKKPAPKLNGSVVITKKAPSVTGSAPKLSAIARKAPSLAGTAPKLGPKKTPPKLGPGKAASVA